MSEPTPESLSVKDEAALANRSANIGCLIVCIAIGVIVFAFSLGGYSAYRLNQYRAALIEQRAKSTLIETVSLSSNAPQKTMLTLKEAAVKSDPWFKGVQFNYYSQTDLSGIPTTKVIKETSTLELIALGNTSLDDVINAYSNYLGGTLQIIDGSVNFLPKGETLEPRKRLQFKGVPPEFWEPARGNLVRAEREYWDIQPMLVQLGFTFPPRTFARYYPRQQTLEIQNIPTTNTKIKAFLQEKKVVPLDN